jgi:RimJ/RimL family protein N-acetyltransferase
MTDVDLRLPRLRLREWREEDWPQAHVYASDPEVVRYLDWGPNTEEETRAFIRETMQARQASPRTRHDLAVALAENDRVIGGCRLWIESLQHRDGSIGYSLARAHWGQGYASELARGLLAFGFETLGLHRIWAIVEPDNLASAHVLEKAGMRREGHLRDHRHAKGRWRDSLLYASLAPEWTGPGRAREIGDATMTGP